MAEALPELFHQSLDDTGHIELNAENSVVDNGAIVERLSCETCVSACCCAGITIDLSDPEASMLRSVGTILTVQISNRHDTKPGRNNRRYVLESDCGNLVVDALTGKTSCQSYETRPKACQAFPIGCYACRALRVDHGVDSPVSFYEYRQRTARG